MSDFNGRIGEILRAVKKNQDLGALSYVIRDVLKAERADGWKEGHSDGQEDAYLSFAAERDALNAEIKALKEANAI